MGAALALEPHMIKIGVSLLLLSCSSLLQAAVHSVIVVGLAGSDDYRSQFENAANAIDTATRPVGETSQLQLALTDPEVDRRAILDAIAHVASEISAEDDFVLTLIGHGSYDGERYRFNVAGPDLTDEDLYESLSQVKARHQLVVAATSASGALIKPLQFDNRTVVTATKSGGEINAVEFPVYWAEALSMDLADADHNELLTIDEAFEYASNRVAEHYRNENLMATEHARISESTATGLVLARLGSLRGHTSNPRVNELLQQRELLAREFEAVVARKSQLSLTAYLKDLEDTLVPLARLQQQLDAETGWQEQAQ